MTWDRAGVTWIRRSCSTGDARQGVRTETRGPGMPLRVTVAVSGVVMRTRTVQFPSGPVGLSGIDLVVPPRDSHGRRIGNRPPGAT